MLITSILIMSLIFFSNAGAAEENDWEQEFVQALQKGKIKTKGPYSGLRYATVDSIALDNAIRKAMEKNAPPCEVIKIAVDLEYNPYSVIKKVLTYGGKIDLDQLCICGTESGIDKQILAKAATDARIATALCCPIYSAEEIAQAQCLREVGLGYTPVAEATPPGRIIPPPPPQPFSVSSPI